ncbi:MAG TPA: glycoside hydrolase family 38 C-terminal domain-containing protein, partial [Armatimonadota bacterium]
MEAHTPQLTIHMIGNAHLDPAWLWRWPEGVQEALATFRSALERMEETPAFIFTRGEAAIYAWIEEYDPALFAQITQRVREGRIWVVNGWIVQADCNLPCGESFVRQALYGKKYFREKFAIDVKVAYSVDAFGHHANLPQILRKCGYELYVFTRPVSQSFPGVERETDLASTLFNWQSPDGSSIPAFHIPCWEQGSYGIHINDLTQHLRTSKEVAPVQVGHTMSFFGVGNHGGGPTKEQIAYINQHALDDPECQLIFSHPYRFLTAIREYVGTLPVVDTELNRTFPGCYSSCAEVKRLNRRAEYRLIVAERLSSVTSVLLRSLPYPRHELERAWWDVLFNQFHDILCGCSIPEVYDDARMMLGSATFSAERIIQRAVRTVARLLDTRGEGIPIVVFNPSTWDRSGPVEIEPWLGSKDASPWDAHDFVVVDSEGCQVDAQLIKARGNTGSVPSWLFTGEVPALGCRVYHLVARPQANDADASVSPLCAGIDFLQNEYLRVEIDRETGWICRIVDRKRDVELLHGAGNVPIILRDTSDSWGKGVQSYRDEIARVRLDTLHLLEAGPLRATLLLEGTYQQSRLRITISLQRDSDVLSFTGQVQWAE